MKDAMLIRSRARRLAVRVTCRAFGHGALKGWLAGALLLGCLLLPLRHGWRVSLERWWPLTVLPVVLAAGAGWRAARRHRFSPAAAAALLDARCGGGGLLVSEGTPGWDAWRDTVHLPERLTIRWHEPRLWQTALLATVFAVTVGLWPNRPPRAVADRRMELCASIDTLQEQIDLLADTLLDEETVREILDMLDRLSQTARSDAPAEVWDALDLLASRLREHTEEAADTALSEMLALEALAALAEAMRQAAEQTALTAAGFEALEALAAAIEAGADADYEAWAAALAETLRDAREHGFLDAERLAQLAEAWRADAAGLFTNISQWSDAQLIDPALLQACTNGMDGATAAAALADWLEGACAGGVCGSDGGGELAGMLAMFGISRGPGAAELTLGAPTDEAGATYVEARLPPGAADASGSVVVGVYAAAPDTAPVAPAEAGHLAAADAGGGAARRRSILPRHRRIVAGYFERDPDAGERK